MGRETVDIHGMSYKQMKFKYSSIEAHTTTEIISLARSVLQVSEETMISKADNLHPIYMKLADVHGSKGDRGSIITIATVFSLA